MEKFVYKGYMAFIYPLHIQSYDGFGADVYGGGKKITTIREISVKTLKKTFKRLVDNKVLVNLQLSEKLNPQNIYYE